MLALARGEGQSIIIDGNIEVKVVRWSRSSVRLAIQAPREVSVDRDEIWRRMHPGKLTPLEHAEQERKERFAREGAPPLPPHALHGTPLPLGAGGLLTVKAPAAGKAALHVESGQVVAAKTVIAMMENGEVQVEVLAGIDGTVNKVIASQGQMVAAGDALFEIRAG
jgi:carbon storage regulator